MINIAAYKPYIVKAMLKLNKNKNLHLALFDIKTGTLLGFDILRVAIFDKATNKKFESNVWVDCFDPNFKGQRIDGIETRAGIIGSNLIGDAKVIGRVAWLMFKDYLYFIKGVQY